MPSNTKIKVGSTAAAVKLIKVSAEPKEAKHDVRRIGAEPLKPPVASSSARGVKVEPISGEPAKMPSNKGITFSGGSTPLDKRPPEQGVEDPDGKWVNLTEHLKDIDVRNKIDGMEIEFTVDEDDIPAGAVRDSYFIAPAEDRADEFLAYLWHGLSSTGLAAIVRYSKTTKQYLGAILAGDTETPSLVLRELEWPQNMKELPDEAMLPAGEVGNKGRQVARRAMASLSANADQLLQLRDERAGQRADLLNAAREGKKLPRPRTKKISAEAEEGLAALAASMEE